LTSSSELDAFQPVLYPSPSQVQRQKGRKDPELRRPLGTMPASTQSVSLWLHFRQLKGQGQRGFSKGDPSLCCFFLSSLLGPLPCIHGLRLSDTALQPPAPISCILCWVELLVDWAGGEGLSDYSLTEKKLPSGRGRSCPWELVLSETGHHDIFCLIPFKNSPPSPPTGNLRR
jgi:hypothetical protein